MLGNRRGVHLDVRVLSLVALEVNLKVALGGESIAADVALEGPLTCEKKKNNFGQRRKNLLNILQGFIFKSNRPHKRITCQE